MSRPIIKQVPTPPDPASDAGFNIGPDHLLCTQGVAGSNPAVSTTRNPHQMKSLACYVGARLPEILEICYRLLPGRATPSLTVA